MDFDNEGQGCWNCGSTETVEIGDERQTINICAGCGDDTP